MLVWIYNNIGLLKNLKIQIRQKNKNENSHNLTMANSLGMYYSSIAA